MEILKIGDKVSNIKTPNGSVLSPAQVEEQYPAACDGVTILQMMSPSVVGGIDNLETLKAIHAIDPALSDEDALAAIIYAKEHPPIPQPSADERIAAAMEYQNLMNL